MGIDGLTKLEGNSFEDITKILSDNKINFSVDFAPGRYADSFYFRDSDIIATENFSMKK